LNGGGTTVRHIEPFGRVSMDFGLGRKVGEGVKGDR
jgi:hypothetical protein